MSGAKGPEESQWNTQVPSPESSDPAPPDAVEWQTLIPAHLLKDDLDSEACKTLVPLAAMELSSEAPPEPEQAASFSQHEPHFQEAAEEEVIFGQAVWLHVYDLTASFHLPVLNSALLRTGGGLFHAGIEVHGYEYSFGLRERGSGVYACAPRGNAAHVYRESLLLGHTTVDCKELKRIMKEMKKEWPGRSYGPITRNCIHFSAALSERLGAGAVPRWVYGLAGSLRDFVNRISDCSESVARLADASDCGVVQILHAHEELRPMDFKPESRSMMRL